MRPNSGLAKILSCTRGLHQRCLSPPILFSMFQNDLKELLLEKAPGVKIWDEQICSMLSGDDLISIGN